MRKLTGNPHAMACEKSTSEFGGHTIALEGLTDATIIWQGLADHAQATLALAFEQRTANLLKALELQGRMQSTAQAFNLSAFDVAARLGLGGTK